MRVVRLRLRNFRGVHDREVVPAERGVTVLEGDNEVGKTSTIVALDLLVDERDDSKKKLVRACAPIGVDAGPEVEAEIVSGPYHLTYRKRWLRRARTELTVHAPRPEQLTGREAHDRVLAVLDETMDRALWKALRVEQHGPLAQAELDGHAALSRALERAAADGTDDTGAAGADEAGLLPRVEQELRRYRTPGGRPTGELRAAEERRDTARAAESDAAAAVAAVETDVAERDRLDDRLPTAVEQRRRHRDAVARLEEDWLAVQSRRVERDAARDRAETAHARAESAAQAHRERAAAIAAADELQAELARTRAADAEHEAVHTARREYRDARRAERDTARAGAAAADEAARVAAAELARAHDLAELGGLGERLARAEEADAGARSAERALAAVRVTEDDVARLDALALDLARAEAARDAGAPVLELAAVEAAVTVEVDGETLTVSPDELRRLAAPQGVEVRLPGVLDVRVRPGRDATALAEAVTAAADALATACSGLGVADPAAAREQLRTAQGAERRRDEHRRALERECGDGDLAALRDAHARVRERVEDTADTPASDRDAPPERAAPPDLDGARRRSGEADVVAEAAHRAASAAEAAVRTADEAVRDGDTEAALRERARTDAAHADERARDGLAAARAEVGDEQLAERETELRARARAERAHHERVAAALDEEDPAGIEERVGNARAVRERYDRDVADLQRRRAETAGRLQLAGSEGRHDRHAAAAAELDVAEREHAAVQRRDRAATLLHDTLVRHRDEVRRAYVAPFRREVERLGRIVFGPRLALEVDDRLRITHRTLDGVTVPFDELSAGAREQLALCARLACAALVDPADGVPVVVDDALGHTDPERLARLGAVFTAATGGAAHQVLVLTCTPERYRSIGPAHVVPLAPSPTPRAELAPPAESPREAAEPPPEDGDEAPYPATG